MLKSFRRTTKLLWQNFLHFYYIKQVDNILPLSVQLQIHGRCHNVVRASGTHSPRRLVGHFFVLTTLIMTSYNVPITEQTTAKCNLFVK